MKVKLNGNWIEVQEGVNIAEFLVIQKIEMPDMVTVQLNEQILSKEEYEKTIIKENDELEMLYFMGGGSIGF
ncbi:MAG: sulfur carrier protein [Petroclostridium sp.]|jgi:sulfur carrier protein|uniref:sulfur carrier protein ThiS n=1 Tax=Petroclostridium xylanilyticum TaxID=1792311 RepID=UPI000B995197|nr:sulfur carrier protein ThiS [Petroclostridium xylanilyticum]MBZ4644627.1 thiS2 [Clostridia bacterium]MDK2810200.1 sulfur carrier protein [Petroclostridium sp.]